MPVGYRLLCQSLAVFELRTRALYKSQTWLPTAPLGARRTSEKVVQVKCAGVIAWALYSNLLEHVGTEAAFEHAGKTDNQKRTGGKGELQRAQSIVWHRRVSWAPAHCLLSATARAMTLASSVLAVLICFAAGDDDWIHRLRREAAPTEAADNSVAESGDSKPAEDTSAVNLESLGTQSSSEASVQGATCEKWVTCKDGFFGNIRCTGSRHCEAWR
eukprot:Skav228935  [mRNA]  locus=scaffold2181:299408:300055:+ [translate_table: standard]